MAVSHIEKLRTSFPQHFVDQDPQDLEDSTIRIPTHEPDPATRDRIPAEEAVLLPDDFREDDEGPDPAQQLEDLLAELPCDEPLEPMSENLVGILGGYPGGPINNPSGPSTGSTTTASACSSRFPAAGSTATRCSSSTCGSGPCWGWGSGCR